MPVNIGDILGAPDEKLSIEGTEVHMVCLISLFCLYLPSTMVVSIFLQVTFIGTLENIEMKQTNIAYTVRDDTGTIEVVQWIEGEVVYQFPFLKTFIPVKDFKLCVYNMQNPMAYVGVMENTFVRVIGSIRQSQDRRHIMAFRVAPLTSANEITTHLLETQYVRLKLRQIKRKSVGHIFGILFVSYDQSFICVQGQPMNGGATASSFGGMAGPLASSSNNYNTTGIQGLTNFQTMVYNIIQVR